MYLIRPLTKGDLRLVETGMRSGGMPDKHARRLELQGRGTCTYLFAWLRDAPVGHLLLTWTGPELEPMKSAIRDSPEVGDLLVREDLRSRGIGGCLLENAERLVVSRGFNQMGLAVGIGNERARRLYERFGYVDAGFSRFTVRWTYLDRYGREQTEGEECVYLTKRLVTQSGVPS
ncbi:MAG TPA: GNAT family N-acetyltransferase [Blastocatellia bacterium]|nr:GNAT family N-acetyltransferase [Blastocatellia bacterium]